MCVAATPLGYAIQFYPYAGKDDNYNKDIDFGGSVVITLMSKLPTVLNSNYHVVMDNFFTSPSLLRLLKGNGKVATGTVRANRMENAPLQSIDDMRKMARASSDVVNDNKSNVTLVRWKDNKVGNSCFNPLWKRTDEKGTSLHQRQRRQSRN